MAQEVRVKNTGLRGVTVADTKISYIDGEHGILIYRGYRIEELAQRSTFPEVAHLLLKGNLPDKKQLAEFNAQLVSYRDVPGYILDAFRKIPREASPMDVLQGAVPLLALADPELADESRDANLRKAFRLVARLPVVIAAWNRIRQGLDPLPSDNALSHAGNFLWQLTGQKPSTQMAGDLDVCLVLHADHTFNASTFACREVVSTKAHMYAGVAAGVGALSGSLHGGANERVMRMLEQLEKEVSSADEVAGWVQARLERGEKIMGMGHAVYKTDDPRSKILRVMSERMGRETGRAHWYEYLTIIEKEALRILEAKGKPTIKTNVDFFSGSVYAMMGIPTDIMTPVFAISRISGWCAHIIEEKFGEAQEKPALYRPQAEYVGDYCGDMGCVFIPLDERG